jgi:hypothetical protein
MVSWKLLGSMRGGVEVGNQSFSTCSGPIWDG